MVNDTVRFKAGSGFGLSNSAVTARKTIAVAPYPWALPFVPKALEVVGCSSCSPVRVSLHIFVLSVLRAQGGFNRNAPSDSVFHGRQLVQQQTPSQHRGAKSLLSACARRHAGRRVRFRFALGRGGGIRFHRGASHNLTSSMPLGRLGCAHPGVLSRVGA